MRTPKLQLSAEQLSIGESSVQFRRKLDPTKNIYPVSKGKGEALERIIGGVKLCLDLLGS